MHHLAIMKKSWGLTKKILSGEKTIETRWYKNKSKPWDCIDKGDLIFFKDSGDPVIAQAEVESVEQYSNLTQDEINALLTKYSSRDLGTTEIPKEIKEYTKDKRYSIIIHLKNVQTVGPFEIDKRGYGLQCAWITVKDIEKIKLNKQKDKEHK